MEPLLRSTSTSRSVLGGDRVRDRLRAGAARPPPPLARRAPHRRDQACSTRSPASRSSSSLLPITGLGFTTALIALRRLHAADPLPQRHHRPGQRARTRRSTPPRGMGLTARQLLLARRAAAGAARDPRRPADRRRPRPSGLATLAFLAGAGGLGAADRRPTSTFKSNVVVAGGLLRRAGGRARHPAARPPSASLRPGAGRRGGLMIIASASRPSGRDPLHLRGAVGRAAARRSAAGRAGAARRQRTS